MNHSRFNKTRLSVLLFLTFVLIYSGVFVYGAKKKAQYTDYDLRLKGYSQHEAMKATSLFKNVKWQFLGPLNISGRMTDVEVVVPKGKNYTIYVAGASGGVWRTVNEGTSWQPIFQHAASTAIGDLALAPSDQDIIWVGTGEANIFRSSQAGAGIYKSTDAGKTWKHMGLTGTYTIPRIIVHPTNPDIVYVAAGGHEWTDNEERGIFKTVDGGNKWQKILYVNEQTGANDLVMDPTNPDVLYATTWQRIRKKWNDPRNESGYAHSGIYKTVDGGKTWKSMNKGLPQPSFRGRIGIDICRAKPDVLYAFVDDYEVTGQWEKGVMDSYGRPKMGKIRGASVYKSEDGAASWHKTSQDNAYMEGLSGTYGWVFAQIRVDPVNENKIYVMGLGLNVSEDSGKTFKELKGMHGDHHGLWIDPANPDYLINVNDGGVAISYDGKTFRTFYDNLPLVQFFNVMYDMSDPFYVYGSIQDHGSYRGRVDLSKGRQAIPAVQWENAPGGEGSSHAIDPTHPDTVYSAGFYGNMDRTCMKTGKSKQIVPKPAQGEPPFRGQWLAPFIISPHNPRILYLGLNHLFRSMNRGDKWEKISPDLSYNDPHKIGDIQYQTIFCISESPFQFGLIYAGTDDGRLHITRNSGTTWQEITRGLAKQRWMSRVIASRYDKATVYVTQNGKRDDDFTPYIWKSTDYGKNWQDISGNIPLGPVNVIREDPVNAGILYVGTDAGVYITLNGGKEWQVLAGGLPTTYVHDLVIHPRDRILVAATHGRGMYALDVKNIQELNSQVLAESVKLFQPEDAKLPVWRMWQFRDGKQGFIHYYLKESGKVEIKVMDAGGKKVAGLKAGGDKGLNMAVWDLKAPRQKTKQRRRNPFVQPGDYTVILTTGSTTLKQKITVLK